ncbi:hypothetical protein [Rhodovulum strictum]|uniref:Uncharacterized protein n=1 Tax=Rhodovulum strictum TaxID=58314 RepID=A0A844BNX1_9RHOB|nr:hypothetical protein [Rhodovulum strictum]MRH22633.1 hypothetical protein [Rhodovulum strictum]
MELNGLAGAEGGTVFHENKGLGCPTSNGRGIESIGENSPLSNRIRTPENENPGALAGATGALFIDRQIKSQDYHRQGPKASEPLISVPQIEEPPTRGNAEVTPNDRLEDRHRRAVRLLGHALTSNNGAGWHAAAFVWAARLHQGELTCLAAAALLALEPDLREDVFRLVHWGEVSGAGAPIPPFLNVMDEARFWASMASRREAKAYALASFEAMTKIDRAAFLRHITKEAVHDGPRA